MAYGKKYISRFRNRFQNDYYRIEIWEKDFVGDYTDLTSGESGVFNINWPTGDTDILEPIKSSEATFALLTDGSIGIEDFYSDDDERFRVDFYYEYSPDKLLWTGYLVQDGASEDLTDIKHNIVFKATDNVGLLKNVLWNEVRPDDPSYSYNLWDYITYSLVFTGLYDYLSASSIPLILYGNLFENTTDDRSVNPTNDPFRQTILYSNMFQDDKGDWDDCYSILQKILGSINADLIQAEGNWNVRRIPEYKLFTDGEIPGTQFTFDSGQVLTAVTMQPMCFIARNGVDVQPIAEDQIKQMQRSVSQVQNAFDFNQPNLIDNDDLQLPFDAIPYDTEVIGDFRYDRYDLATYFPTWVQRNGDTSYLEVVTDIAVTPEQESDRYILKPADFDVKSGVQFNPILVSQNDTFDFTLQFKTFHTDGFFWVRFRLIAFDGTVYSLNLNFPVGDPPIIEWEAMATNDWFSDADGIRVEKNGPADDWFHWSMDQAADITSPILIPKDGVLLIEVDGNSSDTEGGFGTYTTKWRDINLTFNQLISNSTKIIGQQHTDIGVSTSKLTQQNSVYIDDSPRNTIAGTLFTDAITVLGYTDTDTGENTDLGSLYVTRTHSWHRDGITEELRLGNITTEERLQLQYTSRLMVEGSFKNVRYNTDKFISPLTIFSFDFIPDRYFIAASMEIDYMQCIFKARLVEIFSDLDSFSDTYTFNYIYETQQ